MDVNHDFQFCEVRMSLGFPKINYNSAFERKICKQENGIQPSQAGSRLMLFVLLSVGDWKTRQEDALS